MGGTDRPPAPHDCKRHRRAALVAAVCWGVVLLIVIASIALQFSHFDMGPRGPRGARGPAGPPGPVVYVPAPQSSPLVPQPVPTAGEGFGKG